VFVKRDLLDQDVIQQIFVQLFLVLMEVILVDLLFFSLILKFDVKVHVFQQMKNLMAVVVVHQNILDQLVVMIHVIHHHV
jgi:hypothetical protein